MSVPCGTTLVARLTVRNMPTAQKSAHTTT
jgi:hypothetical protein